MPCKNHPLIEDGLVRCARCAEPFCSDCVVELGGQPFCAACKAERLRDLRAGTAAAVSGTLRLATIGRRFGALFLDGLILGLPLSILLLIALFAVLIPLGAFDPKQQENPMAIFASIAFQLGIALVGFVANVVYQGLMLSHGGQTLGKKAMSIKVVTPEGRDITTKQAWIRPLVQQAFGLLSCFGIVNYLTAFGAERTCIHDMAAKTRVVDWP
ncbi:MAG TPA: RDD family protein [Thermoanaerobaculia bacterium]|nr:RDD family protein [Thermoanaerobaculia bacterium]